MTKQIEDVGQSRIDADTKMMADKMAFNKVSHSVLCILCSIMPNIVHPSLFSTVLVKTDGRRGAIMN